MPVPGGQGQRLFFVRLVDPRDLENAALVGPPHGDGQAEIITGAGYGRQARAAFGEQAEPGGEPEGAADAGGAAHAGVAAHQLRQLAGDRQAQTGAAVAPGGRVVGLFEGREQPPGRLRRDADAGILDLETQRRVFDHDDGNLAINCNDGTEVTIQIRRTAASPADQPAGESPHPTNHAPTEGEPSR